MNDITKDEIRQAFARWGRNYLAAPEEFVAAGVDPGMGTDEWAEAETAYMVSLIQQQREEKEDGTVR